MSDAVILEVKGLENLLKALKAKPPEARVGILGSKTVRSPTPGESQTSNNATLGAIYEYKLDPNRPGGSFLRVPVSDHLQGEMERSGAFDKETLAEVVKAGSVLPWLKKVATLAEGIVLEAFATGGFGKWKPSDMTRKKNHQTLVETKQLRDSITNEVRA